MMKSEKKPHFVILLRVVVDRNVVGNRIMSVRHALPVLGLEIKKWKTLESRW